MFADHIEEAYNNLAKSIQVVGPIRVDTHSTYLVSGIADNNNQLRCLCWCILGFLDTMDEIDMQLESTIGQGKTARDNLYKILCKRLGVDQSLSVEQKTSNRNPLIQEIIGHVLVHIHKRHPVLLHWLGDVKGCRNPHHSANDSGLDMVALGRKEEYFPIVGEAKAYEQDPIGAFDRACKKFTELRRGDYDDELRGCLKILSRNGGITDEELANCIWVDKSNFGAVIGFDICYEFDPNNACDRSNVTSQPAGRLYLISTAFSKMIEMFDRISIILVELANSLEAG